MTKIRLILFSAVSCFVATSWVHSAPPDNTDKKPATAKEKPATGEEIATGNSALARARELLAKHDSIRANIIETVEVADRSFDATGRYLQRGKLQLRMEFELKLGKTGGTLLEVCDGDILWTRHAIGKELRLTRRNVKEILAEAEKNKVSAPDVLVAEMGLGGLVGLLAALEQSMSFDILKDETLDDKNVWMIQGTWTKEMFDRWVPPQATPPPAKGKDGKLKAAPAPKRELPPLVPDTVRIYLDRQTGFPLKIQYLKKVAGYDFKRPMLTLAFRDIELNVPIDDSEFFFAPPDTPRPIDLTPLYRQRIQAAAKQAALAKEQAAQAKKQPAAKAKPAKDKDSAQK